MIALFFKLLDAFSIGPVWFVKEPSGRVLTNSFARTEVQAIEKFKVDYRRHYGMDTSWRESAEAGFRTNRIFMRGGS